MEKILEQNIIALLQKQEYLGHFIQQFDRIITNTVPTAGVGFRGTTLTLYINPIFWKTLTFDEQVAVLQHECFHPLLGHLTRGKDYSDKKRANVSMDCLIPGQLISGTNKPIEEVASGDITFGHNESSKVVGPMNRFYEGNVFKIKASGCLPITLTENHPVLVHGRKWRSHYPIEITDKQWIEASMLEVRYNYVLIPKIKGSVTTKVLDLSEFLTEKSTRANIDSVDLDEELAYILGLYVAEGSKATHDYSGVDFGLHKNETHLFSRIQNFAKKYKYRTRTYFRGNTAKCSFSSTILSKAFCKWCGDGAHNKKIPDFILNHSDLKLVESFLDGYVQGDGSISKRSITMATVSKVLITQLQLAYARLDNFLNISESFRKERKLNDRVLAPHTIYVGELFYNRSTKRTTSTHTFSTKTWRWKDYGDYIITPIVSIDKEFYSGMVYNIETENHEYSVNNIVTHNCALNQYIENLPKNAVLPKPEWEKFREFDYYYDLFTDEEMKKYGGSDEFDVHDWDDIPKELAEELVKHAANKAKQKTRGNLPANIENLLSKLNANSVDWKKTLRRYMSQSIKELDVNTKLKRNRRYGLANPGWRRESQLNIFIAVDVSGSVSDDYIQQFFSEIDSMANNRMMDIEVFEVDMQINQRFKYKKGQKINVLGRGGTDYNIFFEGIKKESPDLIIYLGDGESAPVLVKPKVPVIWGMMPNCTPPNSWGKIVNITLDGEKK